MFAPTMAAIECFLDEEPEEKSTFVSQPDMPLPSDYCDVENGIIIESSHLVLFTSLLLCSHYTNERGVSDVTT